tara:strand:+ start:641 stop:991 length:351 start_codon:yes stop_codon:yes gene_type:complete
MSNIKEIIEKGNVKFTVEGINHYRRGGENNEWGDFPKIFKVSKSGDSIREDDILLGGGMNINKLGPTCITLYTFDMLGKRTTGKINYKDITILKETKDIPGFEGTLDALNEITILK